MGPSALAPTSQIITEGWGWGEGEERELVKKKGMLLK